MWPSRAFRAWSVDARAIALALVATAIFTSMHALVRYVSAELHPFEIAFFRSLFALAAVTPLLLRAGPAVLLTQNPRLLALRGLTGALSLLTWFYGLSVVPIAVATALSFTSAIFAAIGATIFLRERMRARRWCAVALGFAGTLVILRPGLRTVEVGSLLVLVSALLWGAGTVLTKQLLRTDGTLTIVTWIAISFTVATAIPAFLVWRWPTPAELGWLTLIGGLATLGTFAWTNALKLTEASLIIPVDFTRLVWASVIGFFAFSEVPDGWTWSGGGLIVLSTAYISLREIRLARERGSGHRDR